MLNDDKYFARNFLDILKELRGGICIEELTANLYQVTKACQETGKSGSVSLTLKILPQGSNQAIVSDVLKKNVPAHSVQPTIMFLDEDSNLVRKNPKQMTLGDIVDVAKGDKTVQVEDEPGQAVEVNSSTGEVVSVDK